MAIIAIKKDYSGHFECEQYELDTERQFGGYENGDLVCYVQPFFGVPLTLDFAIRQNGALIFRSWTWTTKRGNNYLHTSETPESFTATAEQRDTVNGLFSGRIRFEGLKIPVGATVQKICPVDVQREEQITGEKMYSQIVDLMPKEWHTGEKNCIYD